MNDLIKHFSNLGDTELFACVMQHSFNYRENGSLPYFKLRLEDNGKLISILLKQPDHEYGDNCREYELIVIGVDGETAYAPLAADKHVLKLVKRIRNMQREYFSINGKPASLILKNII